MNFKPNNNYCYIFVPYSHVLFYAPDNDLSAIAHATSSNNRTLERNCMHAETKNRISDVICNPIPMKHQFTTVQ